MVQKFCAPLTVRKQPEISCFTKLVHSSPPLAVGRNERSWGRLDAYLKMKG